MEGKYYTLTDNMKLLLEKATPPEREYVVAVMDHYIKQYKVLKQSCSPETLAYNFSKVVDDLMLEAEPPEGEQVTCKKGCSNCCYIHVDISEEEAKLILEYCREEGIEIDWPRLKKQKRYNMETYFNAPKDIRRCVFLENDLCKIYQYRPMNCRKMYSLDDPKKCDLSNGLQKIKRFVSPRAEIVACAVMTATKFDTMASLLLKYKHHGNKS